MIKKIKNPVENIINIESKKKENNIELSNRGGYFVEKYYFKDIYDDKKMKKFIVNCEKLIRTSVEYTKYIGFLKEDIGMTNCAILGNINDGLASIEFHHYPFTLYDIVNLCISKYIMEDKNFNTFIIARDVLEEHYTNNIGLVPLSETVHKLVHSGKIFVNLNQVYGNLNGFVEKYYSVMSDELIENYNKLIDFSSKNINYSAEDILKKVDG